MANSVVYLDIESQSLGPGPSAPIFRMKKVPLKYTDLFVAAHNAAPSADRKIWCLAARLRLGVETDATIAHLTRCHPVCLDKHLEFDLYAPPILGKQEARTIKRLAKRLKVV